MDSNQLIADKDAQKTSKGAQLAVKGDPKSGMTASAAAVKEASYSMTGNEKPWSTPKKVGGSFLETKLNSNKVEEMMKDIFLGWNWYNSQVVEGRILLVWKQDIVQVTITQEMDQLINCEVKIKGVKHTAYLSFVPWLVVGDFNAVFEFDDRIGGRMVTALEVEDSRQWRAKALLNELRSSGSFFTWSNKQKEGSRIFSKLDRVLINELWLDIFPDSEARINWDTISDHCYCLIKIVQYQDSEIRPFRYYNMWASHKDFRSIVLNIWSKPTGGYGLQKIIQKLRRLKPVLTQFNKKQVGDVVQNYVAAKQKYELAQFLLQQSPSSSLLQQEEIEAAIEYDRISKSYESFLRQKSKINWLGFGDENTAYFHDVKRALFSIPSIKSPGPDGFGSGFYKALWKDIGEDNSEAILMFFERGVILAELNGTILSLIPKVDSPTKATDYRLIACCNTLYKCISKMICFRLAKVLPVIIHQNQGAFIKNRQLPHNILILQDILCGYTRKNISPQCVLKIDLSKAYDFIDWVFIKDILTAFCFPGRFIQWIMTSLAGTSYTLMFNGRLQGSFEGRKGLRQGNPISPLLFVLAMEYLTRLLKQASHHREFRFHPMCKHLQLVNLCFADDLILFCKGNFRSVQILFEGFSNFCHCSGLAANLSKSQIFFGGVAAEVKNDILKFVALGEGNFPMKYLGVSLRPTRWLVADCGEIIKKIQTRLHVWANRHLSFAGRTQLIFFVLLGICNYWMNIFMLPYSVIQEIDRLCRNFLRGAKNNRSKFHCSSWSQVCLPKVLGGLGFKEGSNWNKVLLAKYLWALSSKQDMLWVKWIDGVYLKGNSFWSYQLKPDVSWYWRKLCYLRETFTEMDLEATAAHGNLKVKSLYSSMLQRDSVGFAKAVWCSLSVPKHHFILWQSVLGHLLTRDNLVRCQIEVSSKICPVWELLKHWLGPGIWPNQWDNWKQWLEGKPKNMMHRI
ncbi:uncharacterized protein LOC133791714 [Humulus lupulus]|uniref:uncharacterized protein LOC133791714 n=1 Tax=Humulus lupulus TaxID=3486 RepID=UPI002B410BFD|nr:uncharacterized protein LOC133791714 [Humulus lupulus]